MTFTSSEAPTKGRILFGTTVGLSAKSFLRGQLAWFRKQGWDVTLVTSPDDDANSTARSENVSFSGIVMKREIAILSDLRAVKAWIKTIRTYQPDVVNVGTPKASLLGMFASWLTRVPRRIYTVRGLRLEGNAGPMTWLLWVMERLTITMATDVIAVSPSLGKELVRRKLAAAKDIWIIGEGSSNGVDAPAIQRRTLEIAREPIRSALGIDASSFLVCFVGRLTHAKGLETLFRAMEDVKLDHRVQLLIIGSIENERSSVMEGHADDRVHLLPWTDDVWGYLPAIDTLCLPTFREGFPNVILEAAAAGIPAITTRATGAIDSVIDGETGFLIEVGDSRTLVERLNWLAADAALTHRLGNNAKRRAEKHFSPLRIWQGIEAIAEGRTDPLQNKRLNKYVER